MRALKLVSLTVLLVIVLALIKLLMTFVHPASAPFTNNLIVCLQIFLLGGVVFWLLTIAASRVSRRKEIAFWKVVLLYIMILTLLEIYCTYLLRNGNVVSEDTKRYLVEYYMGYERKIPERTKECGRYDPELICTYQPNAEYYQETFEFSDSIHINKAGLRDDNNSLLAPDIICLGDSYTMGWGVQQEESFPQLIENTTGLKVLNAGISSYGTARELMLLNRLDTSNLKVIIIQYSSNDIAENNTYIKNNYKLPVPAQEQYDSLVTYHSWSTVYFPFKRCLNLSRIATKDMLKQLRNTGYLKEQWKTFYDTSYVAPASKSFMDILYRSGINFRKVKVLVVDMNRYPLFDHHFLEAAGKIMQDSLYSAEFKESVRLVQTPELNDNKCFYEIDNHLTRHGHAELARYLTSTIKAILTL